MNTKRTKKHILKKHITKRSRINITKKSKIGKKYSRKLRGGQPNIPNSPTIQNRLTNLQNQGLKNNFVTQPANQPLEKVEAIRQIVQLREESNGLIDNIQNIDKSNNTSNLNVPSGENAQSWRSNLMVSLRQKMRKIKELAIRAGVKLENLPRDIVKNYVGVAVHRVLDANEKAMTELGPVLEEIIRRPAVEIYGLTAKTAQHTLDIAEQGVDVGLDITRKTANTVSSVAQKGIETVGDIANLLITDIGTHTLSVVEKTTGAVRTVFDHTGDIVYDSTISLEEGVFNIANKEIDAVLTTTLSNIADTLQLSFEKTGDGLKLIAQKGISSGVNATAKTLETVLDEAAKGSNKLITILGDGSIKVVNKSMNAVADVTPRLIETILERANETIMKSINVLGPGVNKMLGNILTESFKVADDLVKTSITEVSEGTKKVLETGITLAGKEAVDITNMVLKQTGDIGTKMVETTLSGIGKGVTDIAETGIKTAGEQADRVVETVIRGTGEQTEKIVRTVIREGGKVAENVIGTTIETSGSAVQKIVDTTIDKSGEQVRNIVGATGKGVGKFVNKTAEGTSIGLKGVMKGAFHGSGRILGTVIKHLLLSPVYLGKGMWNAAGGADVQTHKRTIKRQRINKHKRTVKKRKY